MYRGLFILGIILAGCATGEPIDSPECPRACQLGERRCGQEIAVSVCIEGADGCPQWGEPMVCPDETACLDGVCQLGCRHACAPTDTGCANGGVQACGDADGDGCREWQPPVACDAPMICDEGRCVDPGCADACTPGEATCTADGLRTCEQTEACAVWTDPAPCPADQACVDGACVVRCVDDCVPNATRCADDGVATCVAGPDGCLDWSPVSPCGAEERCDDGACVPEATTCTDGCAEDGARICEGDAFRRCGQYDPDPCLELSDPVACADTQICRDGACEARCNDACAADTLRCGAGGPERCGDFDADPCLEWGPAAACGADERCDEGRCIPDVEPCAHVCPDGAVRCVPGGVQVCGDFDADPCLEWRAPEACAAGESCRGGRCEPDCADTCAAGERRCVGGGVAICGDHDADPCLEFSAPSACPAGQVCSDGQCRLECVDECAAGSSACGPDGERRCGDFDADDCLDWSSPVPCGPGEGCVDAACAPVCQDTCDAGARRCDGLQVTRCVDTDADGCVEWGPAVDCPVGEQCVADACAPIPDEDLHLHELIYDGPGADGPAVFIELVGPPGVSVDDMRLIAVNGANGQTYAEIALQGVVPADGILLIAHTDAAAPLAAAADLIDGDADLQNGPDNIALARGAAIIDRLGYGQFGPSDVFEGQGQPAAEPLEGQSLQRINDTGDNQVDWAAGDPSPGSLGCVDGCAANDTRCLGDLAQRCVRPITGCLRWAAVAECDPAMTRCEAGACVPLE